MDDALRAVKIGINDQSWASGAARADGLRTLAILQLGTTADFDTLAFVESLTAMTIRLIVPRALRSAIRAGAGESLEQYASRCGKEGTAVQLIDDSKPCAIDGSHSAPRPLSCGRG